MLYKKDVFICKTLSMLKLDQLPWVSCNMSYLIYIDRIHAGCFYSLGLSLNSDLARAYFLRSVHHVLLLSVGEHSNHLGLGHLLQRWICPSSANNCKNSELICCNRGMGEKWSWLKKVNGDKVVFFLSLSMFFTGGQRPPITSNTGPATMKPGKC